MSTNPALKMVGNAVLVAVVTILLAVGFSKVVQSGTEDVARHTQRLVCDVIESLDLAVSRESRDFCSDLLIRR